MEINTALNVLHSKMTSFDFYERRPGKYQLILPILHEDGDMIDIYLQDSPKGEKFIRICDFGMAVMRLSYTYELNTPTRKSIFESILTNNRVNEENGNLYIDTQLNMLHEQILQFAGCVQKICSMSYWSKETVRSSFYEDLKTYTTSKLREFNPTPSYTPLPDYDILKVDWHLTCNNRNFYMFGVNSNDKAKNVAIALLEFSQAKLPFTSCIVHEDMDSLGKKELSYLTRNADKQYPALVHFQEQATADIQRLSA